MRHNPAQPRAKIPIGLAAGAVLVGLLIIGGLIFIFWREWLSFSTAYPLAADVLRFVLFAAPVSLGVGYGVAGLSIWWRRYGMRESVFADKQIAMMRATKQVAPLATSFTYHDAHQITAPEPLALPEPASAALPGALDLSAIAHTPTLDHILLGVDELGQITVSVTDLCHVALLGSTGGGKSNLLRLILPQLQKIGASVILADPHFAPIDPENGDDWRPIADRLIHAPAVSAAAIDQELSFMLDELGRRLELRRDNKPVGPPLFFAFDELPVICDLVKDAPARLGKLLREGRKVALLTVGASQSMLIKEVGGSSTLRDQYRTAFYVGGDRKSAAAMLDMPERTIDDGPLGKGIVLLRSKATAPARLVRVPLVSNASLYQLLGVAGSPQIAPTEPLSNPLQTGFGFAAMAQPRQRNDNGMTAPADSGNSSTGSGNPPSAETARIIALFKGGKSIGDIIRELHGPIAGEKYKKARAAIEAILQDAMQGVK
ncbi:MAG: DUF87 domain-containing protein [Roseiflexaceae bacterium]|nr:DUF87 domain-containing protein [Roseiflexaceae bacterium]